MNRLPQEIYDEIATFLQGPAFDRPALATISCQWQTAIERHTFRSILLRSTDLDRFQEIVQNDRRRYVNVVNYLIVLPAYTDQERCRFEREDDRRANDEAFTAAIYRLFHILKSWDACKDGYIELGLRDVYSISDHLFLRRSSPPSCKVGHFGHLLRDENDTHNVDLYRWRFRFSYIRLLQPSELPIVPVVRSFFTYPMTRNICDCVHIEIATRLPSLRVARWRMNDWEIRYIALRRAHRHDLAQVVAEDLPRLSALQSLTVHMNSIFFWAPKCSIGTLDPGNFTFDTLSDAIRTATGGISTLRELYINGTIDGSLLWPGPAHTLSEPYWQNLEHLRVHFTTRRPSGGCYFWDPYRPQLEIGVASEVEMPPGYAHSEEEDITAAVSFSLKQYRDNGMWALEVVPDNDSLVPLIEAFGRACLQIPVLKSAELSAIIPAPAELDAGRCLQGMSKWGVWYFSPGTSPRAEEGIMDPAFFEDIHQRRLFWDVKGWRPDTDLRSLLGNIGCERYGTCLVEKFVDTWGTVGKDKYLKDYKARLSQNPS
ncbi:hypothetical protein F4779DRAFT_626190 [Xylariaceae sp. FL0662B]|nr:hypothetical protein F4779DRAFT_626190 [Xylariaceae sp. FL0662B]